MKVYLNDEDKGDRIIIISDGDRLLISQQDLLDMGAREVPAGANIEGEYIYIDSLPGSRFELDKKESALHITVDPHMLKKNMIDFSRKTVENVLYTSDASAFLNYGLYYNAGNDFGFKSLAIPLEIGVSGNGWLGLSNFNYAKTDTGEKFTRLMTSITRDDVPGMRRLVVGDVLATSGTLGSGEALGGVSISRNFSTSPFFIKYPGLQDISGMAGTPSDLEIYSNNILIKKEHISPGQFDLQNFQNITGRGDLTVVIRDAFGRAETLTTPYYIATGLLAPGLQDYSYNIGFKRRGFGTESFSYGDVAFLGFHRIGISRDFTGGFRAEADKDTVNAGPTASCSLWRLGELDTALAFSYSNGRSGYGFYSNYTYAGKFLSAILSVRGLSRGYTDLELSSSADKQRIQATAGLGFREKTLGSLSVSYSLSETYETAASRTTSIFYSRNLAKNVLLNVFADTTKAEKRTYEVRAGLIFLLGKETTAGLDYSLHDGVSTETVMLQQNPPRGEGFGYNLSVAHGSSGQDTNPGDSGTNGLGFLQYNGPYGIYSADFSRESGVNNYTLSASGGVAFINRSFYLSRPIYDSFALVKAGGLENVRVNISNLEVGATGKAGEIIVPDIISYYPNRISIDETDIPVNYSIRGTDKLVSVPYRGGGVISFDVLKLQAFVGRFYVREKGRKAEAEYWGCELRQEDHVTQAVVGKKGEFYMENIPAGMYHARLFMKKKECKFDLTIPKSDESMVDMGEITCDM